MAANFFEQFSPSVNVSKPTIVRYNFSLRFASMQIALSVPDIEARSHALAYFIAEEQEYCSRLGTELSSLYDEAKTALENMTRRIKILHNIKQMSDIYENCRQSDTFEQLLAETLTRIEEKPLPELKQTYDLLKSKFYQISSEDSKSLGYGV